MVKVIFWVLFVIYKKKRKKRFFKFFSIIYFDELLEDLKFKFIVFDGSI